MHTIAISAKTLRNLQAFFAHHYPRIKIELTEHQDEPGIADGIYIAIVLPLNSYPACKAGIAFGALRRSTPSVQPVFAAAVSAVIRIPYNASFVHGSRHPGRWAWSLRQWRDEVDENDFGEILDYLQAEEQRCDAKNMDTAAKARLHPANIRAQQQIKMQQAIVKNSPTAAVDAYICRTTGRTMEQLASYSNSTRRKLRHEARQAMEAK